MDAKWIGSMVDGSFESNLPELSLQNGYGIQCQGQGIMRWSRNKGVTLEATTDGAKSLWDCLMTSPCKAGELYPADWYLSAHGQTQDGWQLSIERIVPNSYHISGTDKPAFWSIPDAEICSAVQFSRLEEPAATEGMTELIVFPNEIKQWPRGTEVLDKNPIFGSRQSLRDWLQFSFSHGEVSVRAADNLLRIRVEHNQDSTGGVQTAISLALSFVFGKRCHIESSTSKLGTGSRRAIYARDTSPQKRPFPSPIGVVDAVDSETMLSHCANLFVQEDCPFSAHVCACLESADRSLTSQAVIVCASLEAVLQTLTNIDGKAEIPSSEELDKIETCLKEAKVDDKLGDRVKGFLTSIGNVRPVDILKHWKDKSLLEITNEDLEAYKSVRNRVAHGGLLSLNNEVIKSLDRLKHLFNKCILQAAGYEGQYMDYTDWSHHMFPLADSSKL